MNISRITNYMQLINAVLGIASKEPGVKTAGEGDVYNINYDPNIQYPVFWVSATQPQVEHQNTMEHVLTLYYIDRLKEQADTVNDTNLLYVHSAGMNVLRNVINKLRMHPDVLDIPYDIQYTLFNNTQVFNDNCNGVYTTISVYTGKTNCIQ